MHWNYRIVRMKAVPEDLLEVREVYYDHKDQPRAHGSATLLNEAEHGVEGIRRVLDMMAGALEKPVLEEEEFLGGDDWDAL